MKARLAVLLAALVVLAVSGCATAPAPVYPASLTTGSISPEAATTPPQVLAAPNPVLAVGTPAAAVAATSNAAAPAVVPQAAPNFTPLSAVAQSCCKVCRTGKACGNTCISRSKRCHVGQGCACDG